MFLDVLDLRNFYAQPLGGVTAQHINLGIRQHWPNLNGLTVLGMGYAPPYLRELRGEAERTLSLMPAQQGAVYWPSTGASLTSLVDANALPLPDSCIDRILLVHMLELVDNPADHLREIWRVLTPGGRLLVVVPNRRGVWARLEHSPFAYGRPFSKGQLTHLMRDTMFTPVRWSEALHFGPFKGRGYFGSARLWEKIGKRCWPAFAGVHIVEATKLMRQALPAQEANVLQSSFRPVFLPVPHLPNSYPGAGIRNPFFDWQGERNWRDPDPQA
ncbi:class I SAM-dependent methyltransferase [uncultured Cohaesibacter sp.]|uniref:class I SAM-dependent methyltransferase n=1 Tax=uncultured Cohaesibacter sp. TaxID=1002546 RepID=UPI0029C7B3BA|nr:class I SAM-dependent methyltransferase [uncultured Cohaesibacter sp.]